MVVIQKEDEKKIKNDKEIIMNELTELHANIAFKGQTILDFDEYLIALAMFPISIAKQAGNRGIGLEEIMTLIAHYLETFPVREE